MVTGSWFDYFKKITKPLFDEDGLKRREERFRSMYGDFFENHLFPEKGKLLSLGAGFGATEVCLARRGYHVIGVDNDRKVLELLEENAKKYGEGRLEARFGDLLGDFHNGFLGETIQACVSFGLLEHFLMPDLLEIIRKQFMVSPFMICMVPINTPATLETFKVEGNPEGNVDENGIYRNFWEPEFWEQEIFKEHNVVDKRLCSGASGTIGRIDMVVFAIRKGG